MHGFTSKAKLSVVEIVQFGTGRFRLDHIAFAGLDLCKVFGLFECK